MAALDHAGPIAVRPTLADGLAGNIEPGSVTIDLVRRHVAEIVTVTEGEIAEAMRVIAREHGLIVEGSGAVGAAALLHGKISAGDGVTAILATGRNIAPKLFAAVLDDSVE
jgi:threonine dehydratase